MREFMELLNNLFMLLKINFLEEMALFIYLRLTIFLNKYIMDKVSSIDIDDEVEFVMAESLLKIV